MPKQLNVNLAFNADTSLAKALIKALTDSLRSILATPKTLFDEKSLKLAITASKELELHLKNAVNTNTGKLDLSKFSASLKRSNKELKDYKNDLLAIGPAGQRAFLELSKSIANSEAPFFKLNKKAEEFLTTLKNTARWQISSGIVHGFMGALLTAYGYAQDLNQSLNNILIVTGHSSEYMANFADKANKAAQALSTTTTAYTDAALIFYQLGLNDEEVEKRTNAVIKMSLVTGDSASEVSSYMTAIWNNFDDGSKKLSYYTDVMAALGASTASSSSEIASGVLQFAAISNTVGLSYEYATSALATLVSNTRKSADEVGNSLRTIFSRLLGLKLGETLEDGVDLNKYSAALLTIGVNIVDASGNMMEMDEILESVASKWEFLSKAQLTAFALTVGGVRLYTLLIALMDNWGDMQNNLETAKKSEGTTDVLAAIYAKSWEAARDRVKSALEDIYSSLINDEFFIDLDNIFTGLLKGVSGLIKGLGGFKGILGTIGGLLTLHFAKLLPDAIEKIKLGLSYISGSSKQDAINVILKLKESLDEMSLNEGTADDYILAQTTGQMLVLDLKLKLLEVEGLLSSEQKLLFESLIAQKLEIVDILAKKAEEKKLLLESNQKKADDFTSKMAADWSRQKDGSYDLKDFKENKLTVDTYVKSLQKAVEELTKYELTLKNTLKLSEEYEKLLIRINEQSTKKGPEETAKAYDELRESIEGSLKALAENGYIDDTNEKYADLRNALDEYDSSLNKTAEGMEKLLSAYKRFAEGDNLSFRNEEGSLSLLDLYNKIDEVKLNLTDLGANPVDLLNLENLFRLGAISAEEYANELVRLLEDLSKLPDEAVKTSTMIGSVTGSLMSMAGMASSAESAMDTLFNDEDATFISKLGAVIGLVSTAVATYNSVLGACNTVKTWYIGLTLADTTATYADATAKGVLKLVVDALKGSFNKLKAAMGLVALAITAVVALIGMAISAHKKNREEIDKNAKAELERLKVVKESLDKNKEMINSQKSAYELYKKTGEGLEDLENKTRELCAAYKDELDLLGFKNTELLIAQGRYEELADAIDKARIAELQAARSSAATAVSTAEEKFISDMREGDGNFSSGRYNVDFGNGSWGEHLWGSGEDEYFVGLALDLLDLKYISKDGGDAALHTEDKSATLMIAAYEEVLDVVAKTRELAVAAGKESKLTDSEIYQNMVNWLTKSQEAYDALVSVKLLYADIDLEASVLQAKLDYLAKNGEIKTLEQYNKLIKSIKELMLKLHPDMTPEDIDKAIDSYMMLDGTFLSLAKSNKLVSLATDLMNLKLSDVDKISEEAILKLYEELTDELKELFVTLDFDNARSIDDLKKLLDMLLALADVNKIKVLLEIVLNALDKLKKDMSALDYEEFRSSSGINWGQDGYIKYSEFLSKSYDELLAYLLELERKHSESYLTALEDMKGKTLELIDEYNSKILNSEETIKDFEGNSIFLSQNGQNALNSIMSLNLAAENYDEELGKILASTGNLGAASEEEAREMVRNYLLAKAGVKGLEDLIASLNLKIAETDEDILIKTILDDRRNKERTRALVGADGSKAAEEGTSIDVELYDFLSLLGVENLESYLLQMSDGTYELVRGADEFNLMVLDALLTLAQNTILGIEDVIPEGYDVLSLLNNRDFDASLEIQNLLALMLQAAGIDTSSFTDAEGNVLLTTEAIEALHAAMDLLLVKYNDAKVALTELVTSLDELIENLLSGAITEEEFANAINRVGAEAILSAGSLEELLSTLLKINDNNGLISYGDYAMALLNLGSLYSNCKNEVEDYKKALQNGDLALIDATASALECSIRAGELGKKYNLSAEDIEFFAKELKSSNAYAKATDKQLVEIAKDQMRYDKAVASGIKNLDKWKKSLQDATKSGHLSADTAKELSEAYGDMLDIDGSKLSDSFLRSADNLKLMEDAMNGSEEAYNLLRDLARQDLAIKFGIDDTDFLNNFNNLMDSYYQGLSLDDLEVGALLNDENFLAELSNMVNSAKMTAEEATDYLASMGIDAEVVEDKSLMQLNSTYVGAVAKVENVGGNFNLPLFGGGTYSVPSVTYSPLEVPVSGSVEGGGFALKVKSASKSSGGNVKHTSSNAGTPSSSGKKGGGGGGGGSAPKAKPKEHKTKHEMRNNYKSVKEDLERYHEIENTLDDINDNIDRYSSISSRAFGGKKVKALLDEAKALKQSAKAYDEYLKEIETYIKQDKTDAQSYGWTFDADGNVNNYDELMKKLIAELNAALDKYLSEYNAAVDWWNSLSAELQNDETYSSLFEDMTETALINLDLANDAYEDAIDALKKYEETKELLEEKEKARREALEKALDKELEAIDTVVQVKIQIEDNDLKYLKELLEQCGDSADRAADAIALMGSEITSIGSKANAYKEGILNILTPYTDKELLGENALSLNLINKILSGGAIDDDDRADLINAGITEETINKLQSYQDGLLDVNKELRSLRTEAVEKASSAFSEFTSELDKNSERIAHLLKVTLTYKDVIDIVGKKMLDASGELTKRLDRANFEMQRNNTAALKSELDFIDLSIAAQSQAIADLEADNAGGQHDESIKAMKQLLQDMTDTRNSTYESWLDSWKAECQSATDIYSDTLVTIVDNFSNAIAGAFGSLDALSEEFSRKQDIANMYLSDYELIYNLSKLTRDINKSIDETDNVNSKKALKGLMEDIERMQENGVKLSQYDLENLQKQYELELAKLQLSEAQEAKSEVRMTRDSEGNYGYVYTADANSVANAELNYEDKLYAMQKANGDYINNLQSNIILAELDCANALSALDASLFASYELYQEAVARVQADYSEKLEGYYQQMENVLGNNQYLYNNEWMSYSEMTGYKISADEDYIDSFEETTYSLLTGFLDIQSAQTEWSNAIANAVNEACAAYYQWFKDTELAMADGETSLLDFSETVEDVADTTVGESEKMAEAAEKLADDYTGAYAEIMSALNDFCDLYDARIQKIINSNTELVKSINSVIKASSDIETNNTSNTGTNSTSSNATSASSTAADWNRIVSAYRENTDANGLFAGASANSTKYTKEEMRFAAELHKLIHEDGKTLELAKKLMKFDTGGYTGKWDSSLGRLALLHEKELVLNSSDTENFLKAVELIRTISQTIDLNALSASSGFATLLKSFSISSQEREELQLNVTITAEFPNATNHSEIEQAFDNLINRAAQFANRKN